MKTIILFGAAISVCGQLAAQEFNSLPAGREILTIQNGYNYLGLRFHRKPVASGPVVTVPTGSATVTVEEGVADALVSGTSYLFEIDSGDALGAVLEITAFNATANTVTLSDDVSSDFSSGDCFTIRPSATLASIFGATNSAGLDAGSVGAGGADQIWLPNGAGGFDRYYYDNFSPDNFVPEWVNAGTSHSVDPTSITIFYPDGLTIVGSSNVNTFRVAGTLKLTSTNYALGASYNYMGTVFPTGSTLATLFGENNSAGLDPGFGGVAGADKVMIPDGAGGFDQYYYDEFSPTIYSPSWTDAIGNGVVDPTTINLDGKSGMIILNNGANQSLTATPPGFYGSL